MYCVVFLSLLVMSEKADGERGRNIWTARNQSVAVLRFPLDFWTSHSGSFRPNQTSCKAWQARTDIHLTVSLIIGPLIYWVNTFCAKTDELFAAGSVHSLINLLIVFFVGWIKILSDQCQNVVKISGQGANFRLIQYRNQKLFILLLYLKERR